MRRRSFDHIPRGRPTSGLGGFSRVKVAILGVVLIAGLFFGFREVSYRSDLTSEPDFPARQVRFTVDEGESVTSIAGRLAERELVVSAGSFARYLARSGLDKNVRSGAYVLSPGPIPAVAEQLTVGAPPSEIRVTIREGLSLQQVDDHLAAVGLLEPGEFFNAAVNDAFPGYDFLPAAGLRDGLPLREGYFFPDTYFFEAEEVSGHGVAAKMLRAFAAKTKAYQGRSDFARLVTIASLVEKEASPDEAERRMVAGVIGNRIEAGMQLGIDATTRAAVGKWTGALTASDLKSDSPWNTRRVRGLPPGAIAGFGTSALDAAADPKDSDYLYYLHGADGRIRYARTLGEHVGNKDSL